VMDSNGVEAKDAGALPEPAVNPAPGEAKPRRKATRRDYAITIFLIVYIVWSFGLYERAKAFVFGLMPEKPQEIMQNFIVFKPGLKSSLDSMSKTFRVEFRNVGDDNATVKAVLVRNMMDGRACRPAIKLPLTVKSQDAFNVTAQDCATNDAAAGKPFSVGVVINGTTTVRSKLMTDDSALMPIPMGPGFQAGDVENLRTAMKEQAKYMDGGTKKSDFSSQGLIKGTYE